MKFSNCQKTKNYSWIFLLLILVFSHDLMAGITAGQVESVKGQASAQSPGEPVRTLEKGSEIFQDDIIRTEKASTVQLLFNDQTKFILGADTELNITTFKYQDSTVDDKISLKIIKGTFRFITGLIAHEKPESMEVNMAVATIGIRGTHVIGEADETSATVILAEPDDGQKKTSIEVSNQYGAVVIDEPGYGTEIPDQFSPPSPPQRMRLETINNLMRSLQNIQRINMPRPRMP